LNIFSISSATECHCSSATDDFLSYQADSCLHDLLPQRRDIDTISRLLTTNRLSHTTDDNLEQISVFYPLCLAKYQ